MKYKKRILRRVGSNVSVLNCTKCGEIKKKEEFGVYHKDGILYYRYWCKDCWNEYRAKFRKCALQFHTECEDCKHYSLIWKKCKKGIKYKKKKCVFYEEFGYYNL